MSAAVSIFAGIFLLSASSDEEISISMINPGGNNSVE
jgi:hypothetical protein